MSAPLAQCDFRNTSQEDLFLYFLQGMIVRFNGIEEEDQLPFFCYCIRHGLLSLQEKRPQNIAEFRALRYFEFLTIWRNSNSSILFSPESGDRITWRNPDGVTRAVTPKLNSSSHHSVFSTNAESSDREWGIVGRIDNKVAVRCLKKAVEDHED